MNYIRSAIEETRCCGEVLEVGAYNVNGSVRELFADRTRFPAYIGLDRREGPGVDRIWTVGDLPPLDGASFGVVVSTEMLEHDNRFWLSLQEMHRVLRVGGHCLLTTRGIGFKRHDYPSDFWRFTADGLREALEWAGFDDIQTVEDAEDQGVFGRAQKTA